MLKYPMINTKAFMTSTALDRIDSYQKSTTPDAFSFFSPALSCNYFRMPNRILVSIISRKKKYRRLNYIDKGNFHFF